jgi:NADH-quinone oxidoreductase subunit E
MQAPEISLERVDEIIEEYQAKPTALIMILQEVQNEFLHLPRAAMERISERMDLALSQIYGSERMDLALSQIYGVATFYKAFSLEPRGRHQVCVCRGTACHVRNSLSILERLEGELGVRPGETTDDGEFTLETVNCVGACALGPVVVADDRYYGNLTVEGVGRMIDTIKDRPTPSTH